MSYIKYDDFVDWTWKEEGRFDYEDWEGKDGDTIFCLWTGVDFEAIPFRITISLANGEKVQCLMPALNFKEGERVYFRVTEAGDVEFLTLQPEQQIPVNLTMTLEEFDRRMKPSSISNLEVYLPEIILTIITIILAIGIVLK